MIAGTLLAFFRYEMPSKDSHPAAAGLTFVKRVAYQRAIEEVYWRHRIWPRSRGERPDPKPSLDAVMSQAQLEKKVADYLRESKALEDYWQRPLSAEELQAEIDRMVNNIGANSFIVSNFVIVFHFNTSPAVPGLNTIHILNDAITCCIRPVNEFTCTFTYVPDTPTPTPTATSTPTPSPRPTPVPRPRPTPLPRP